MMLLYSGKDVRIEEGPIVWVCVRTGWWRKTEKWKQVDVRDIEIDLRYTGEFTSPYGAHSILDLGIRLCELSHLLGQTRVDREGAEWIRNDANTVFGKHNCINVARKEITGTSITALVIPFSAVEYIGLTPKLNFQTRGRGTYSTIYIGDFPWPPEKIAEVLGVPLRP